MKEEGGGSKYMAVNAELILFLRYVSNEAFSTGWTSKKGKARSGIMVKKRRGAREARIHTIAFLEGTSRSLDVEFESRENFARFRVKGILARVKLIAARD